MDRINPESITFQVFDRVMVPDAQVLLVNKPYWIVRGVECDSGNK